MTKLMTNAAATAMAQSIEKKKNNKITKISNVYNTAHTAFMTLALRETLYETAVFRTKYTPLILTTRYKMVTCQNNNTNNYLIIIIIIIIIDIRLY